MLLFEIMNRAIINHIPAFKVNMGGLILDQALPSSSTEQIDPFLLLHHWKSNFPAGGSPKDFGVGPHPHRGFSPVSFILDGAVMHQDSRGNVSEVGKNGVQWMNSGMGIVHSERPAQSFLDKGGEYELIQLWINSPQSSKMKEPKYIPLAAENIPTTSISDQGGTVQIIAGSHQGIKGGLQAESPMDVYMVHIKKGEELSLQSPAHYNTLIYIIEGGIAIAEDNTYFTKDLIQFGTNSDVTKLKATADSKFLYLSGQPLNEPMVAHGPFVMNSESEILEAIRDYQIGKMGMLVEEFS